VTSEQCKHANEVMSKVGSEVILKSLLNMEIDIDALPMGPEEFSPAGIETVVLAQPVLPRGRIVDVLEVDRTQGQTEQKVVGRVDKDGIEREVTIKLEPED
jgi:DEAD/DEAH box helicase domain-containing protein